MPKVVRGLGLPIPMPTLWYIEPAGVFSNNCMDQSGIGNEAGDVTCYDGKSRKMWAVTYTEVLYLEQSRKDDTRLGFSVWYKNKDTNKVELWRSDKSYKERNPALRQRRKLSGIPGVTTGDRVPAPVAGRPKPRMRV